MRAPNKSGDDRVLLSVMATHCAASLGHFIHNAVYIKDYPNLPPWLTATGVYAAWVAITTIGAIGYMQYRRS